MTALLKKLNFKAPQTALVLNAPETFADTLQNMRELVPTHIEIAADASYDFIITFAYTEDDIQQFAEQLNGHWEGDVTLWFAYIKKSSKKYKTHLSRGADAWQVLGKLNFEGVRQVAIDEDWSAIRFRQVDFIKTMKRSFAMSEKGKARTK